MDPTPERRLSPEEAHRYARHLVLPEVGEEGQLRLKTGSVLIVGAGGLGSPAALYLAAAGVGRIGLVEFDRVEASNLQRQILYGTADTGRPKLEAAAERLAAMNPQIRIEPHARRLDAGNALDLLSGYDVIADGTDNFATRYLVNDACVLLGKPNVYGSVFRFEGQASVFHTPQGPCYRCLFPEPPEEGTVPSCAEGGVLGVLPGLIGVIQATEAIKILLGTGQTLAGRLLLYDALAMEFRELKVGRNPGCPICGENPVIRTLVEGQRLCGAAAPAAPGGPAPGAAETPPEPPLEIPVQEVRRRLDRGEEIVLLDVREPFEVRLGQIPGSLWIPLAALAARVDELGREDTIVVYCHVGGRSRMAAQLLRKNGFPRAHTMQGGIDAWSRAIDPSLRRY